MKPWRDTSITKKLYLVIGTMAVLIACELATLRFAMHTLSAVRAFVAGEGSWSKAQKDAAFSLQAYALTRNEDEYQRFIGQLEIPGGDHQARIELLKPAFDMHLVREGFLRGRVHPADIDAIVDLLRHFSNVSYLAKAIEVWTKADLLLDDFRRSGERYHDLLKSEPQNSAEIRKMQARVGDLNAQLTQVEAEFSAVLGEGSRWMEHVVVSLLFLAVLMVESIGLTLTFLTARALSRGLAEANGAAARIGGGDFSISLPVRSRDELGHLAAAINQMRSLLDRSHRDLEARVASRTSDLETMARENARLYEEASGAVRMRDEFLSIASHEIKTPLTALTLQLQMLIRQVSAPDRPDLPPRRIKEQLESCLRQSRRLTLLSGELMDLTRIRLGKLEIQATSCDLSEIVRDAALSLGAEAAHAGSSLGVHASTPVMGHFDALRVGQVATNLISNAIKYGDSKPISIRVSRQARSAVIEICDHGVGIAQEDQTRVFDRFERVDKNDVSITGLGLGLYITRQIVEKHGGIISVRSEPGKGSLFMVEFPLVG